MTDLLLADLHITPHQRDRYRLDFLDRLPALAKQHGADVVYILGDITDQKDKHGAVLVNQIVDRMTEVASWVDLVFLAGNHDHDNEDPFFRFLRNVPNIEFVHEPMVHEGRMLLPHTRDYKRDWAGLDFTGVKRIYTHVAFNGAETESGTQIEQHVPVNALPRLPIYSGDIHVPQQLFNIVYVGAPYTIRFGDSFEPRALLVNDKGWESLPLDGPQKRLLRVDQQDRCTGLVNPGDVTRISIELSAEDYARWDELREYWKGYCEDHGYILDGIRPVLIASQKSAALTRQVTAKSDEQIVYDYCERNSVDQPSQKMGLELL